MFCALNQATFQMTYLMYTGSGSWVIVTSALFSLVMLTLSVTQYDAGFLKWSIVETPGKFFKLLIFRVLDVAPKILSYALLWYTDMAMWTAVVVAMDLLIGSLICLVISKKFSRTLVPCCRGQTFFTVFLEVVSVHMMTMAILCLSTQCPS